MTTSRTDIAVDHSACRLGVFCPWHRPPALAGLNHPSIASIYDFLELDGRQFLVLELVERPTIAERLVRGPIPVPEAVTIAGRIASALEVAHARGIVHRDLKPANCKLHPSGQVKVLDFSLAKDRGKSHTVVEPGANPDAAALTRPSGTAHGVILGTSAT
jgi:serine/threonine protein kinase